MNSSIYKEVKCVFDEECGRKVYSRGICRYHYQFLLKLVTAGTREWEEFEKFGMTIKPLTPPTDRCHVCGKRMIPDTEAKRAGTDKWDGYTYKFSCKCFKDDVRICVV